MAKIYFDTSVIKRPFDDQSKPRVWLEASAFSILLQMIEGGEAQMISSSVLEYEHPTNPVEFRRAWMDDCMLMASNRAVLDDNIIARAEVFENNGLKAIDALHVACAEAAGCDYFVTCDDGILLKDPGAHVRILAPGDLVRILEGAQ